MRILASLSLAIGLAACATAPSATNSAAATAAAPGVQQASAAGEDPNKPVCRIQPGFGGAPGQRICLTKAQWETEDSRDDVTNESMQNSLNSRKAWVTGPVYQRPN